MAAPSPRPLRALSALAGPAQAWCAPPAGSEIFSIYGPDNFGEDAVVSNGGLASGGAHQQIPRVVTVAVRPPLLQSVLERVLTMRGWRLVPLPSDDEPLHGVVVASPEVGIDLTSLHADVVVVLPDERGSGGFLRFADEGKEVPFPREGQILGVLLDLLEFPT